MSINKQTILKHVQKLFKNQLQWSLMNNWQYLVCAAFDIITSPHQHKKKEKCHLSDFKFYVSSYMIKSQTPKILGDGGGSILKYFYPFSFIIQEFSVNL